MLYYIYPDHKEHLWSDLLDAPTVHTGEWQSMNVQGSKVHATHELEDSVIWIPEVPPDITGLEFMLGPDVPWAEDHFGERVSGTPWNPPPSATRWPYAVRGHADHTDTMGQFDHTYPERFWPKFANEGQKRPNGRQVYVPHNGIRFEYGDLSNVVDLLVRNPLTRQAYLPVWFPEDTGAVDGQRVPCTLGYHFMIRKGKLSCRYYIRSCDLYRHMVNDIYMACRLMQWVCTEYRDRLSIADINLTPQLTIPDLAPGRMLMFVSSLHLFVGDVPKVRKWLEEGRS